MSLSEAKISETCSQWLALDGWRMVETDPKHLRGLGVSEPGMADKLYVRYCGGNSKSYWPKYSALSTVRVDLIWIEWKTLKGKPSEKQKYWHARERALGALTLIAGENFPATIEGFCRWYVDSGLQRRRVSIPSPELQRERAAAQKARNGRKGGKVTGPIKGVLGKGKGY